MRGVADWRRPGSHAVADLSDVSAEIIVEDHAAYQPVQPPRRRDPGPHRSWGLAGVAGRTPAGRTPAGREQFHRGRVGVGAAAQAGVGAGAAAAAGVAETDVAEATGRAAELAEARQMLTAEAAYARVLEVAAIRRREGGHHAEARHRTAPLGAAAREPLPRLLHRSAEAQTVTLLDPWQAADPRLMAAASEERWLRFGAWLLLVGSPGTLRRREIKSGRGPVAIPI